MTIGQFLTSRLFWAGIAVLVAIVAFIVLPSFLAPVASSKETEEDSSQVVFVETLDIKLEPECRIPIWYTGEVTAKRNSAIGFQRSGKVISVLVDEGDYVEVGSTLAELDHRQASARSKQLEAEVNASRAQLAELEQGPRHESIRAARSNVEDLTQQLENSARELTRYRSLLPQGAISQQEFDAVLYQARTIKSRVEAAQAVLDELESGTRSEQLDAARARLEVAKAAQQIAGHDVDDCTLKAPFSGTITRRMVDEGAVLDAGQPVINLLESRELELHIGMPPAIASEMEPGTPLQVEVGGKMFDATVKTKVLAIDRATRTQKVIVALSAEAYRRGVVDQQMGRIQFEQVSATPGFRIPTTAIVNDQQGLWSCYSLEDRDGKSVAKRESVEVIHFDGDWVFVRGTLSDGQKIVAKGLQRLTSGQQVEINNRIMQNGNKVSTTRLNEQGTR